MYFKIITAILGITFSSNVKISATQAIVPTSAATLASDFEIMKVKF